MTTTTATTLLRWPESSRVSWVHEEGLKAWDCCVVPGADKEVMELRRRTRSGCLEKYSELSLEIEGRVLPSGSGNEIASSQQEAIPSYFLLLFSPPPLPFLKKEWPCWEFLSWSLRLEFCLEDWLLPLGCDCCEAGFLSLLKDCPLFDDEGWVLYKDCFPESRWKDWPRGRWYESLDLYGWRESSGDWWSKDLEGLEEEEEVFLRTAFSWCSRSSKTWEIILTCSSSVSLCHSQLWRALGPKRLWHPRDMTIRQSLSRLGRLTAGDSRTVRRRSMWRWVYSSVAVTPAS